MDGPELCVVEHTRSWGTSCFDNAARIPPQLSVGATVEMQRCVVSFTPVVAGVDWPPLLVQLRRNRPAFM